MRFSLNIDHVATLRNARGETQPDPIEYALLAEKYGVDGIVVHLREDRRHVKDDDVYALRKKIATKLDLEMAANDEIIEIARDVKPELSTLVPEKRQELTTEGGLDVAASTDKIHSAINRLHEKDIRVSLFIEPEKETIDLSKKIGADFIEIHTGKYANAVEISALEKEFEKIKFAAEYAKSIGLGVNAGHGLNYENTAKIAGIASIDEVSIGQAVVTYSVFWGLEKSIKDMKKLLD